MAIVIKEIVVRTTVEKTTLQRPELNEEAVGSLRRQILDELRTEIMAKGLSYGRFESKKRR